MCRDCAESDCGPLLMIRNHDDMSGAVEVHGFSDKRSRMLLIDGHPITTFGDPGAGGYMTLEWRGRSTLFGSGESALESVRAKLALIAARAIWRISFAKPDAPGPSYMARDWMPPNDKTFAYLAAMFDGRADEPPHDNNW